MKKTVEQLRSCAYDYSASIDDAISPFFLENSLGHDTTIESVAFVLNVARVSDPLSPVSQRFYYFSFFFFFLLEFNNRNLLKERDFFKEIYIYNNSRRKLNKKNSKTLLQINKIFFISSHEKDYFSN